MDCIGQMNIINSLVFIDCIGQMNNKNSFDID